MPNKTNFDPDPARRINLNSEKPVNIENDECEEEQIIGFIRWAEASMPSQRLMSSSMLILIVFPFKFNT
jgi:hypothetical protein